MLNFALITHSKQKTNKKQFYLCWFRIEIIVNFSSSFVGWKQPPSIISYTLTPTVNSGLIEKKKIKMLLLVQNALDWCCLNFFSLFQPCNLNAFRMPLPNTQFIFAFSYFRNALLTLFHFTISHNFPIVHTISKICWWCVAKKNMIKMHKETISRLFVRSALCSYFLNLCVVFHDLFCFVLFVSNLGFPSKLFFFYFRSTWISYTKFHHTHSKIGHYTPHRTTNMSKHQ